MRRLQRDQEVAHVGRGHSSPTLTTGLVTSLATQLQEVAHVGLRYSSPTLTSGVIFSPATQQLEQLWLVLIFALILALSSLYAVVCHTPPLGLPRFSFDLVILMSVGGTKG